MSGLNLIEKASHSLSDQYSSMLFRFARVPLQSVADRENSLYNEGTKSILQRKLESRQTKDETQKDKARLPKARTSSRTLVRKKEV